MGSVVNRLCASAILIDEQDDEKTADIREGRVNWRTERVRMASVCPGPALRTRAPLRHPRRHLIYSYVKGLKLHPDLENSREPERCGRG